MRVDQAQPLETRRGGAKRVEARDEDALMIAQEHHADFSPAVDQQADLPVDRAG
jgi:hypothetical protein